MQDSENGKKADLSKTENVNAPKSYNFGGIEEFSLEKIEDTILEESIYLDVFAGSDIAFKNDIQPLENVLSSIANLNCISYNYKTTQYASKGFPESRQIGVVAQELSAVFPELVKKDKDGDLQVNYTQLSTVALQAIKELHLLLEKSNEKISFLENEMQKLKKN